MKEYYEQIFLRQKSEIKIIGTEGYYEQHFKGLEGVLSNILRARTIHSHLDVLWCGEAAGSMSREPQ